jgi:class 3 adenylate cyclase
VTEIPNSSDWWRAIEGGAASDTLPEWPAPLDAFQRAQRAEFAYRLVDARTALAQIDVPGLPAEWSNVGRLLRFRVDVRENHAQRMASVVPEIQALLRDIPAEETQTLWRAWHLLGIALFRLSRYAEAEHALIRALHCQAGDGPVAWILDGLGQVFVGCGAWEEARRTWKTVGRLKAQAGDVLGMQITAAHLAQLELRLGFPERCETLVREARTLSPTDRSVQSELRLQTQLVESLIEQGRPCSAEAGDLARHLDRHRTSLPGHLIGFAAVALARCAAPAGDVGGARARLDQAVKHFSYPAHLALAHAYRFCLLDERGQGDAIGAELQSLLDGGTDVTDAEITARLLLARRIHAAGDADRAAEHLRLAMARAMASNNQLLLERMDRTYRELDPLAFAELMAQRFSGRTLKELERTERVEGSVVFADLVDFTPRSALLDPEEVMATVKSLFELGTPLLARHRVRPLAYLGDGLLAVAVGDGHEARAIEFATDVVRRTARVTMLRRAVGEHWGLTTRAGVACGTLVMGLLGSALKQEFVAIGMTTNLAARLQSVARPGEVVCEAEMAERTGFGSGGELVSLKGVAEPLRVIRLSPGALSRSSREDV